MEEKLEDLIKHFKQMHSMHLKLWHTEEFMVAHQHYGKAQAFADSAALLTNILNSENPNSVSNQPTEE